MHPRGACRWVRVVKPYGLRGPQPLVSEVLAASLRDLSRKPCHGKMSSKVLGRLGWVLLQEFRGVCRFSSSGTGYATTSHKVSPARTPTDQRGGPIEEHKSLRSRCLAYAAYVMSYYQYHIIQSLDCRSICKLNTACAAVTVAAVRSPVPNRLACRVRLSFRSSFCISSSPSGHLSARCWSLQPYHVRAEASCPQGGLHGQLRPVGWLLLHVHAHLMHP